MFRKKKKTRRTNYSSIFPSKVQNLTVFFNYLHDSNSIVRARGINSESVVGRTVCICVYVAVTTNTNADVHMYLFMFLFWFFLYLYVYVYVTICICVCNYMYMCM